MSLRNSEVFPTDDWIHKEDPHGLIPTGTYIINQYTVVYFASPCSTKVRDLMVGIKFYNRPKTEIYSTTRSYVSVLRDFFAQLSMEEFVELCL